MGRPENEVEVTAWHEAGHAFVAIYLGGEVESLSVDPDHDDGPKRFGDTTIRWSQSRFTEDLILHNSILVALAGPVVEMLHRGDPSHPATMAEWSQDWRLAWQAAAFLKDKTQRMRYLEKKTVELYQTLSEPNHWAAIGAIVDHLLAYETMDGDTVHEVVAEWTSFQ